MVTPAIALGRVRGSIPRTLALLLCGACAPAFTWTPAANTPSAPSLSAAQVTLYGPGDEHEVLPRGINRNRSGLGVRVSPPHRLLGTITHNCRSFGAMDKDLPQMMNEASQHGANILVFAGNCDYAAIATSAAAAPTASALLDEQATRMRGLERIVVESRRLDRLEPVTLSGKRGTCLAVGYALDSDASFATVASGGLSVRWIGVPQTGDDVVLGSGWTLGENHVAIRTAPEAGFEAVTEGQLCLAEDRELTIALGPLDAWLGRGGVTIAVYARQIPPAELEREIAHQQASRATMDRERRERRIRGCIECGDLTSHCRAEAAITPELCNRYYECLRSYGASTADCPD